MKIATSISIEEQTWLVLQQKADKLNFPSRNQIFSKFADLLCYGSEEIQSLLENILIGNQSTQQSNLELSPDQRYKIARATYEEKKSGLIDQKTRKETATASIEELKLGQILKHVGTFDSDISKDAEKAINQFAKNTVNAKALTDTEKTAKKILQPDGTMICTSCGKVILAQPFMYQTVELYKQHISWTHHRQLTKQESDFFLELA